MVWGKEVMLTCVVQAMTFYDKALEITPDDECFLANRAIGKVSAPAMSPC